MHIEPRINYLTSIENHLLCFFLLLLLLLHTQQQQQASSKQHTTRSTNPPAAGATITTHAGIVGMSEVVGRVGLVTVFGEGAGVIMITELVEVIVSGSSKEFEVQFSAQMISETSRVV